MTTKTDELLAGIDRKLSVIVTNQEKRITDVEDFIDQVHTSHLKCNVETQNRLKVLELERKKDEESKWKRLAAVIGLVLMGLSAIGSAIWTIGVTDNSIKNVHEIVLDNRSQIRELDIKVERNSEKITVNSHRRVTQ